MPKYFKYASAVAVLIVLSSNFTPVQAKTGNARKKPEEEFQEKVIDSKSVNQGSSTAGIAGAKDQELPEAPMVVNPSQTKKIEVSLASKEEMKGAIDPAELHKSFPEIKYDAFKNAIDGFNKIKDKNDGILTIIDYTKPSIEERFYVIDLNSKKILHTSHVAHGRNSGDNNTVEFSNDLNSYKTSPGFFKTGEAYSGGSGYSLKLDGLEPGINDNARARAIVIHGASYANPRNFSSNERLGRSLGCPALPTSLNKKVIDTIKNGTLVYAHSDDKKYISNSKIIDKQ